VRSGETLFELTTRNEPAAAAFALPAVLLAPAPIAAPQRAQNIVLGDMGMMAMMGMGGGMGMHGGFTINGRSFDPGRDDFVARVGVPEEWTVRNDGTMDHPLHVHGTAFQLVASSRADAAADPRLGAFMDTVNTRPGETLRLRIVFDAPGRRPLHCHILEHEDQGMMAIVDVRA
jgi:FtsP/CotA-like multicopper oxidase with cupredoxin domain